MSGTTPASRWLPSAALVETRQRIGALRGHLAAHGLSGFVAPIADPHHTEWLSPGSDRLTWLSGFQGSAGVAVVLADRAVLLTDGRYTVAAAAELPQGLFDIVNTANASLSDWIRSNLGAGDRLGIDPWLHTTEEVDRLEAIAVSIGAEIVATTPNPIDLLRGVEPRPDPHPAFPHPSEWTGRTSAEKRLEIAQALRAARVGALLLSHPESICWLLNIRGRDSEYTPLVFSFCLLASDGRAFWFVDPRKIDDKLRTFVGEEVEIRRYDEVQSYLTSGAGNALWIDPDATSAALVQAAISGGWRIHRSRDPCLLPKAVKTRVEIAGAKAAHARDGLALTRLLAWIDRTAQSTPLYESQIRERCDALRAEHVLLHSLSFETIPASGPNAALPHYHVTPATDRPLRSGEFFLLDSGGQYRDGTTDVTRTLAIGPVSDEMRRRYTLVLRSFLRVSMCRFPPGTRGIQIDAISRHLFWNEGVDYDHSTGHGVGSFLGVHEGPNRLRPTEMGFEPLQPGMISSIEPAFYEPGRFGVRIENLAVVAPSDSQSGDVLTLLEFDALTVVPIDTSAVIWSEFSDAEIRWLVRYQRRVCEELGPDLAADDRAWLELHTRVDGRHL